MSVVPVEITHGAGTGAIVMIPTPRIDMWSLTTDNRAEVRWGQASGVVVDPDNDCLPISVDTYAELFGLAVLSYVDPALLETGALEPVGLLEVQNGG